MMRTAMALSHVTGGNCSTKLSIVPPATRCSNIAFRGTSVLLKNGYGSLASAIVRLPLSRPIIQRSPRRLRAHVAILVFLAAAARARVVAADLLAAVADRLQFLVAARIGRHAVVGHGARGGLVDRGADRPQRFLERLGLLHLEDH